MQGGKKKKKKVACPIRGSENFSGTNIVYKCGEVKKTGGVFPVDPLVVLV